MGKQQAPQQQKQKKAAPAKAAPAKENRPVAKKSNLPEPVTNPCGIPFKQHKMPETGELKGLQIRAELSKLAEPPRSYSEHLVRMCTEPHTTEFGETGRILLSQRFNQIQGAKPAHSPYAQREPISEERLEARREKLRQLRSKKKERRAANADVEMTDTATKPVKPATPNDDIKRRLY